MSHLIRSVIAPMALLLAAGALAAVTSSVLAQPPGFDRAKGGFDRPTDKTPTASPATDPVKNLEDDLAKLKALEADILSQLKKLKEAPVPPTPAPAATPERRGPPGFGAGGRGPGGFGFRGPGGEGGMPRGAPWLGQGISRAFQSMTADQLKEVIGELEKIRADKLRAEAPAPRPMETSGRPGPTQNDEILKRLDRLSQELEEIRKSLKR